MNQPIVLRSNLQLPRPRPETLKRHRLLTLLHNQLDRRLLVITGDAGYGKTTLLAQLSEKARLPGVFLSLEPEDSDLVTFYSGLICGLEKLQPGLAARCQGLVDRGTDVAKNHRLAMGTLLNELVEKRNEEIFIFLDDYHSLSDDSEVHQALDYFIDHSPPDVHLVIASRREPPLPSLPKWRAKRDLAELSREALKFTEEEIRSLLEQFYKISLSETEIRGLAQKTEGWITGVQLILQAAGRDGRSVREMLNAYLEEHGDLFRYFAGEIFNREKEDLRDFLKRSSVLDVMTPEACRCVLKVNKPQVYLEELVNSNLFITVSGPGEYRYHRLFREFLYDQLSDPAERSGLHVRAAEHHEKNGESAKAIGQYLSADKPREAVRLIDRDRERLVNRAQFALLRSWLERLAPQTYDEFPWLCAVQAVLCKEQGKLEQAESLYRQAEEKLRKKGPRDPSHGYVLYEKSIVLHRKGESKEAIAVLKQALKCCPPENSDLKTSILGFTAQVWLEGLGDSSKARTCLNQARKLLKGTANKMQSVYIEQKQSVLWESLGEKRRAFQIYKGIIETIGDDYSHLVGSYFHNAAKVALDYGRYGWAGECLNKGQVVCRGYEDVFSGSMLEFGFGYLYLFKGEWDRAQKHLEKAHDTFKEMNWTRSVCIALRQLSRLARYRGDPERARHYLELMKQQPLGPLDRIAVLMEQALICIYREQYGPARETLDSCRDQAIKYFGRMGEIVCHLAEAGIQAGSKKPKEAEGWFFKAVTLSKDYGFDGLLACELRASPILCRLAQKCTAEKAYLLTIPSFMAAEVKGQVKEGSGLRAELLGPPRIFGGEKEITNGLRRQAQQLLCLLAYHGERGLSREEILEAMWPRVKPKQGVDNFHLVLFEVRQGLQKSIGRSYGKAIVKEGGRYRIGPGLPVSNDVRAFEELLAGSREAERAGDAAAAKKLLGEALSLKRGEFCQGWTEDWVQGISRRLEELHQKALLKLGALHLRDGEPENSREYYELAVGRDELCEEACRGLIRIHGNKGDRNQAKALFTKLEKALRRELKSEPAPETVELYRTVMVSGK
ncbi:MAG: BTAD domain-containing putative transcriptional regulator [Candidatus Edwardsbacteria bacterium]|nr:BTAD domain-containing putative transcriptional regulator [Candidatus Edwardsbacteria bacterium]